MSARGYDAGLVDRHGGVLEVTGADAAKFLHGQLTADVEGLAIGAGAESMLLTPKGRLVAVGVVVRPGPARFLYIVDARVWDAAAARLVAFHLRVDCDVAGDDELGVWSVEGPDADPAVAAAFGPAAVPSPDPCATVAVAALGPDAVAVRAPSRGVLLAGVAGAPEVPGTVAWSREAYDARRVEAGAAAFGVDYDESTVPHDAGLVPRAVSLDKGCYVGQELVERIWSRGHANRAPRSVHLSGGSVPAVGAAVVAGGKEVGHLTTTAWCPSWDAPGGLGLLRVEVEPGDEVSVDGVPAVVVGLG